MIRLVINKLQINLQKGRFTETQRGLDHRKLYELNLLEQTQNVRYHFLINLLTYRIGPWIALTSLYKNTKLPA